VPGDVISLPIRLLSFNVFWEGQKAKITWITATEANVKHFEIERVNANFQDLKIVTIKQAIGNSIIPQNYESKDENPILNNIAYYRLKSVDNDGSIQYSDWRALRGDTKLPIKIYPNPVSDYLVIESEENIEKANLYIYDMKGTLVVNSLFNKTFTLDVSSLPKGTYLVKIVGKGTLATQKVIFQ
jgi:hypothetical protein